MKSIACPISKLSLFLLPLYIYSYLWLIDLSFKDIVTIVVIDILAYLILTKTLDLYLFKKFHPHLKNDFRGLTSERLLELLKVNDITFDLLSRLPLRRSIWTIFVNAIKVIPAGIYIVVFADHGYSYEKALMLFVILEVFLISTFSSMTYIELHYYITDLLHNQQKGNQLKSDELTNEILTNPESLSKEFWFTETVGLLCCTIFFVLQVWVLIDLPLLEISIVRKTITFFAGLFVLARVYFLYQNYFKRGVEKIYERFTLLGDHFQVESLSISSSKALATFELLFFRLVKTIRSRDEEIASWVMNENESSRLRTIGEVSAMIGHDTKGPIHAIEYSLAELQNNSDLSEETKKYLKYISDNTDRLKKLTTSLNVNMRETNQLGEASFLRAHTEVLSLLHYEFFPVEDTEFKIGQIGRAHV